MNFKTKLIVLSANNSTPFLTPPKKRQVAALRAATCLFWGMFSPIYYLSLLYQVKKWRSHFLTWKPLLDLVLVQNTKLLPLGFMD
ncbi:hypothetical protein Pse7429DRAFT_2066 [Pseudanabaena biceps PCC 7429]|uniref:Uncharacterized protein n=1 Tax=Pseudanabaena biceps PCC 7429 TaxID=927668 RepID=L8N3J7_9CYAN|nr:hypothetical protein Pse7429DRAFT_2066 [Pseudanabaena biceps PCC 7429]